MKIILALFVGLTACLSPTRAQTFEEVTHGLPSYVSVLTTWGVRPEWDETGENVYFLHRLVGDVFKINVKTCAITAVTAHLRHGGIQRAHCLSNGDLLLGIGDSNTGDIERDKTKLAMFVLKKNEPAKLYALDAVFAEGLAVSKTSLQVAWTLPGQLEIKSGEIQYDHGTPRLVDVKTIISYNDRKDVARLETQGIINRGRANRP